jgi:hypothetical protein
VSTPGSPLVVVVHLEVNSDIVFDVKSLSMRQEVGGSNEGEAH